MASIVLRGVTKRYGKSTEPAVDDVDLDIGEGEFVVLLGPSGCGKTTTLRLVAGLEQATGGELRFDDQVVNDVPPDRRNVGMVFQNYALYPHMTVFRNLAFGMQARRTPKSEVARRVHDIAELLGLADLLDRRPKELSGGQRQRVALGRALVREPSVFLMDEPLSNLDANLREQTRLELARLHRELHITTLYVTHDQGEALTLADRVVVMNGGRVAQDGTPDDVYRRPADTFVAGFIGSPGMNLWTLPWEDDGAAVSLGGALRLPRAFLPALERTGRTVTVGVRPEHLVAADEPAAAEGRLHLACRAELAEHLGSHVQLHARLDPAGGPEQRVVARLGASHRTETGNVTRLAAPASAVHLFDPSTGRRIFEPLTGRRVGTSELRVVEDRRHTGRGSHESERAGHLRDQAPATAQIRTAPSDAVTGARTTAPVLAPSEVAHR
jgi:ABC-type sugar transport system ATPase subunit